MTPTRPLEDPSATNKCKPLTLTIISVSLIALGVTPAFIDPVITYMKYTFRIGKDTLIYNVISNGLEGALVEAYIFNVTNADKFLAGEEHKIKVEEIGPFTYQEHRNHENIFLNEEDHTLRYTPIINVRFHRDRSIADPKDVNISVPNIPLLAMVSSVGTHPYWMQVGLNMLVNRLDAKPIMNLRAYDFMWGYKDPLIALGNSLMPGWINFEKLGVMDRLYNQTSRDTLVIESSEANKFRIKTVNGEHGIRHRGYDPTKRDRCNTFVDTYEGLAYTPGLTPETKLRLYRDVFCRILDLQYVGSRNLEFASNAFVYRLSNTTFKKNPENECLCGNICVDGMTDLSTCFYGFGVSFSQAHFLEVDPEVYERVDGVKPEPDKHGSEFIVDPNLGTVISTRITLQLNVMVDNADFNVGIKPFSRMVIPVLYFKLVQPELDDETKTTFRNIYYVYPYVIIAVQGGLFLAAIGLLAYAMQLVRFTLLCKKAMDLQVNMNEKSVTTCEENDSFLVQTNSKPQFVHKPGV